MHGSWTLKLLSGSMLGVEFTLDAGDTQLVIGPRSDLMNGVAGESLALADNAIYIPDESLGEASEQDRKFRLARVTGQLAARLQKFENLMETLEGKREAMRPLLDEAAQLARLLQTQLREVDSAGAELAALESALRELDPTSPEFPGMQQQVDVARGRHQGLHEQSESTMSRLGGSLDRLERLEADIGRTTLDIHQLGLAPPQELPKESRDVQALLIELSSMFGEMMADAATEAMRHELKLHQGRLDAQVVERQKEAKSFSEKEAKARDQESTMGCVGKVLGIVVTILSVAAGLVTGGATLALAAVSLALTVTEAATGTNLIGEVLKPVMDNVLKPLIDALAKSITEGLKALGVPAEEAEKAGNVLGSILGAALMVVLVAAVVVVGRAAAARIAPKLLSSVSKLLGESLSGTLKIGAKQLSQLASNSAQAMGRSVGKVTGLSGQQVATAASYASDAAVVTATGNQFYQGYEGASTAFTRLEAAKLEAAIQQSMLESEQLRKLMSEAIDQFAATMDDLDKVSEVVSDILMRRREVIGQSMEQAWA